MYNSLFPALSPASLPVHLPMISGDARALQMLSEEQPHTMLPVHRLPSSPMIHPPHGEGRTCILAAAQPTDPTRDVPLVSVGIGPHPNPGDAGGSCSVGMVRSTPYKIAEYQVLRKNVSACIYHPHRVLLRHNLKQELLPLLKFILTYG